MKYLLLTLFLIYCVVEGKHMPKHIKTCSRKDPKLNECFMKNGNLAMKYIAEGDSQYDIKTLLPLKWEDLLVIEVPPLKLSLINITTYGLENTKIVKSNIDLEARQIQFKLANPSVIWKQNYKAAIETDDDPQELEGKSQIEFVDIENELTFNYDFYLENGVQHANITNYDVEFLNYGLNLDLENLESNKVIKKYVRKSKKYLINDAVMKKCGWTVANYINNIFKHVPFDLVFTP